MKLGRTLLAGGFGVFATGCPQSRHQRRRMAWKVVGGQAQGREPDAGAAQAPTAQDGAPDLVSQTARVELRARAEPQQQEARRPQGPTAADQQGLAAATREVACLDATGETAAEPPVRTPRPAPQRPLVAEEAGHRDLGLDPLEGPMGELDDDRRAHAARTSRATASSTPLTKGGELSLANRRARSTASSITTATGVSVCWSS